MGAELGSRMCVGHLPPVPPPSAAAAVAAVAAVAISRAPRQGMSTPTSVLDRRLERSRLIDRAWRLWWPNGIQARGCSRRLRLRRLLLKTSWRICDAAPRAWTPPAACCSSRAPTYVSALAVQLRWTNVRYAGSQSRSASKSSCRERENVCRIENI